MTIRIFTKQAFKFNNPGISMLQRPVDMELAADKPLPVGDGPKEGEVLASDLFFLTVPYTIQDAPDWINPGHPDSGGPGDMINHNTFTQAVKHGLLVVMPQPATVSGSPLEGSTIEADAAVAQATQLAEEKRTSEAANTIDTGTVKTRMRSPDPKNVAAPRVTK
jgi:hypothetical protein